MFFTVDLPSFRTLADTADPLKGRITSAFLVSQTRVEHMACGFKELRSLHHGCRVVSTVFPFGGMLTCGSPL